MSAPRRQGRDRHRRRAGHRPRDRRRARRRRRADRHRRPARAPRRRRPPSADGVGLTVDVASEDDVARMAAETVERCGAIDILVNNAGLYASLAMRPFEQIPRRGVAPGDGRQRRSHVPHLPRGRAADARAGRRADRQHLVGHAVPRRALPAPLRDQKGAIVALTRALAKELGGDDVLVNCVAPGFTMSDGVRRAPRGHRGAAGRLGRRAHDQARPGARGRRRRGRLPVRARAPTFITGQTMVIDGGQYFH